MKKIIIGSFIAANALFGQVTTLLPYFGTMDYANDPAKSTKDSSKFYGIYGSTGDLDYLLETNIGYLRTEFKDATKEDLKQYDLSLAYSRYYKHFMYKVGIHHTNTTDKDLGDGNTFMLALGGYKWVGYDKYSYGVEGYYSYYKDGHTDTGVESSIKLYQATPYFQVSKAINTNTRNVFDIKVNFAHADQYTTKDHTSFEVIDTLYYKKAYLMLKGYGGEMISGVKDSGMTVYNTIDLMKKGFEAKAGYYFKSNMIGSISYGKNYYREYRQTEDTTNSVLLATFSYSF